MANAAVNARNLDTGFERSSISNQEGQFEVPLLPPGRYEVSISVKAYLNTVTPSPPGKCHNKSTISEVSSN